MRVATGGTHQFRKANFRYRLFKVGKLPAVEFLRVCTCSFELSDRVGLDASLKYHISQEHRVCPDASLKCQMFQGRQDNITSRLPVSLWFYG